jgi:hypothetical protein
VGRRTAIVNDVEERNWEILVRGYKVSVSQNE